MVVGKRLISTHPEAACWAGSPPTPQIFPQNTFGKLPRPDPLSRNNDTGITDLFRSRRFLVLAKFQDKPAALRYSLEYSSLHR